MKKEITFSDLQELDYGRREAFNSLRTNLRFSGVDKKVLLFTSCLPDEGKSTVSFELARSLAENGKRAVYIDADMRKSVFLSRHKVKTVEKRIGGLSHFLSKQASVNEVICESNVEGLDVILSGTLTPTPTELLGSTLFPDMVTLLRSRYDYVIIDSPPLGSVIDAAIMAPFCDGVVIVIEANNTSRRLAVKVKKQLEMADCKILGVVLNKVKPEEHEYYKYYGEYKK